VVLVVGSALVAAGCAGLLAIGDMAGIGSSGTAPGWAWTARLGAVVGVVTAAAAVAFALADREFRRLRQRSRDHDGLLLRVRMADEAAERHRRLAETASAGMFELLSGLVAAEEGARGQLAAELHDTVAQSLAAARVRLDDGDPAALAQTGELVAEAEEQVRAVMARTRPPALHDGDLAHAVAALRDELALRYGVVVELSWPTEAYPLPLVTAVTVYRFFQEALLNVVRHAEVDLAQAELCVTDESVVATVSDDGLGFDPGEVRADKGRHVGLGLLSERARLVGGSLEVTADRSRGVRLTLWLPRTPVTGGLLPAPRAGSLSASAG
jgi:signal transduction histidine kinase